MVMLPVTLWKVVASAQAAPRRRKSTLAAVTKPPLLVLPSG